MSSVTEKLTDENEYRSRKVEFLNEKVMKTEVSNNHLSSMVDNLAKKNGELTDTIALQAKDIAACNNKLDKIFAEQSCSSPNDAVQEDLVNNISNGSFYTVIPIF